MRCTRRAAYVIQLVTKLESPHAQIRQYGNTDGIEIIKRLAMLPNVYLKKEYP